MQYMVYFRCANTEGCVLCTYRTTVSRAKVVSEWSEGGGVLLMGYEMFRLLSLKKSFVSGRDRKSVV